MDARSKSAYSRSHIRGAIHADLFHYFIPGTDPSGLAKFQKDLSQRLGRMGLSGTETVVVYESKFGMRAARVAWMLQYFGTRNVFLLEGGYRAWEDLQYPTETTKANPRPTSFQTRTNPSVLATADEVRSHQKPVILDVRSEGEFRGTEGRDCDRRLGRIPRSQWIEWTEFIDDASNFKQRKELAKILKDNGLRRESEIITYCHRGARAASAFYALKSLGYRKVKNYVGSWHEWSAQSRLPVEK